jgi:hypothetical protein
MQCGLCTRLKCPVCVCRFLSDGRPTRRLQTPFLRLELHSCGRRSLVSSPSRAPAWRPWDSSSPGSTTTPTRSGEGEAASYRMALLSATIPGSASQSAAEGSARDFGHSKTSSPTAKSTYFINSLTFTSPDWMFILIAGAGFSPWSLRRS